MKLQTSHQYQMHLNTLGSNTTTRPKTELQITGNLKQDHRDWSGSSFSQGFLPT